MSAGHQRLFGAMREQAAAVGRQRAITRLGTIDSFNPATYAAKVALQPEGTVTGWLPVATLWVGNGWGLFAPPSRGDQVTVEFQEGSWDAGIVLGRLFSVKAAPQAVPSGELWLVHQTGGAVKLTNDGKVLVNSTAEIDVGNLALAVKRLLHEDFIALYNGHRHAGGAVPDVQASIASHATAILKGN